MVISEVTATQVANFLNVDTSEEIDMGIIENIIMPSAKKHLADYITWHCVRSCLITAQ